MSAPDALDADISALHSRLTTLRAHRSNLSSILLSQPHLSTRLATPSPPTTQPSSPPALAAITAQSTRTLTNIHRACAGVTAYKVQDPDPHARNNGRILGVSIDVGLRGKFVETYHVLLNWRERDGDGGKVLRIHKHTIPPCVPLQQLANRWLPQQAGKNGDEEVQQDLVRFGRGLRRELVAWHLRGDAVASLRNEAGIERTKGREMVALNVLNAFASDDEDDEGSSEVEESDAPLRITEIEADTAVRQITVTWSDRRTAVLSVSKDGRIEKAVCRLKDGTRDISMSRKAVGPIVGLIRRLKV